MPEKPTIEEIKYRITQHLAARGAPEMRDVSIAWEGYIAALLEWGLISPHDHDVLRELLPETSSKVVYEIFVGLPEENKQTTD
jgi:hypothetical protein